MVKSRQDRLCSLQDIICPKRASLLWHPDRGLQQVILDRLMKPASYRLSVVAPTTSLRSVAKKSIGHMIEVELASLLKQSEYCAVAVQHRLLGQCFALFIAHRDYPLPRWTEIVSHIRARLPACFVPSLIYKVDDQLPRLPSGKINREYLKVNHGTMARLK